MTLSRLTALFAARLFEPAARSPARSTFRQRLDPPPARIRRKTFGASALLTLLLLCKGCAAPLEMVAAGTVGLVLSPVMIVAGLAQGLAFLPYTVGTRLSELNRGLIEAHAVTLDAAYRATFDVALADPRVDPQTGQVAGESFGFGQHRPDAVLEATQAFQRLLISQGMPADKARHYAITGEYTHARTHGRLLLAVVYRHTGMEPFRVVVKDTGRVATLRPEHSGWRTPYAHDANGRPIDEVIDWAGIDYAILQQDKVVATLMVIAAESVKSGKRAPDYWSAENRWRAGETTSVMAESSGKVKRALSMP